MRGLVSLSLVLGAVPLACDDREDAISDPGRGTAGHGAGGDATGAEGGEPAQGGATASGAGAESRAGASAAGADVGGDAGSAGGGDAGSDGGGGAAPQLTGIVNEFGFSFDDSFLLMPCLQTQALDCRTVLGNCPNQDANRVEDRGYRFSERFEMGGELGQSYLVTIRVNGIVSGKYYTGGERRGEGTPFSYNDPNGSDTWHTGGEPTASSYAIYKLSVLEPDATTELQHYYLNSFPQDSGVESHVTLPIGYEASFEVPGQGVIELLAVAPICRVVNNCGPGDGTGCPSARNVPNEPGLELPETHGGQSLASLNAVNGASQPFHAQLIHITVLDVQQQP